MSELQRLQLGKRISKKNRYRCYSLHAGVSDLIDVPPASPPSQVQVIEQRLIDCGLDAKGISVRYEDYLQSIEVIIRQSAGATVDQFKCINDAAGYEIVTFEDRNMYAAYRQYTSELARPRVMELLKSSLQEKNLLKGFPERRNYASLEEYARALELHGGIAPSSALRISGNGIVFDPPRKEISAANFMDRYSNLMTIVGYATTLERLDFSFIGNAAVSEQGH